MQEKLIKSTFVWIIFTEKKEVFNFCLINWKNFGNEKNIIKNGGQRRLSCAKPLPSEKRGRIKYETFTDLF